MGELMKRKLDIGLAFAMYLMIGDVSALPYLQIDVSPDGVYNNSTEDSVSTTNPFTLWGLVNNGGNTSSTEDFRFSIALLFNGQRISNAITPDFGAFKVDSGSFDSLVSSKYGTPPVDSQYPDIGSHSIYETYYWEIDVAALEGTVKAYDVQTDLGDPEISSTGQLLAYVNYEIDISSLKAGYSLHFDFYTLATEEKCKGPKTKPICQTEYKVDKFAPFSHDATSGEGGGGGSGSQVPEPSILALLGLGLMGMAVSRKKSVVA